MVISYVYLSILRYMKEQSQIPDLQEREPVPEREYQRVTISGEEKCGVSQSGHCRKTVCVCVFFSYSQIFHEDICFSVLGSIYRSAGCCQMCSEGSVHQAKVHGPVAAELLQNHCSLPAGAEWETPRLRYLWGRDPRNHSHCKYECPHLHHCSCIILYCNLN